MKKILFTLLLITMAFSQFDNSVNGWVNGAYYVPDGTIYGEGVTVVDEGTLAAESLSEVNFASHANWDVTNDLDDTGGNAAFIWSANQTSTLTQIQANLATAGVDAVWYLFTYTVTVTTAFDGDGAATITTGFAASAVSLDLSAGTHSVYFKSKTTPVDFVISIVSGTDTEGTFEIDDVTLKEIQGGDVDVSGTLLVRGVDIGAHPSSTSNPHTVTKAQVGLTNVEDTALSTWIGTTNLTTLGTIIAGTWEGTDVGVAHGGTGKSAWTQYLIPYATTTTSFGEIAIGANGEVLTSGGAGVAPSFQAAAGGGDFANGGEAGTADRTLGNTDAFAMGFETNDLERAQFTSAGHFIPIGTYTYDLGSSGAYWNNFYAGTAYIPTVTANAVYHTGDLNTYLSFDVADQMQIYAGGVKFMEVIEAAADYISIGEASDIDWYTSWMDYNYGNNLITFKAKKTVFAPNLTSAVGTSVADDAAISVTAYIMRMVGADADALLDTDPAINDGSSDGQIVIIQGVADANTVTIADNVNTQLNAAASCTLGDGDVISLMWDSDYSMWIELYRSDN